MNRCRVPVGAVREPPLLLRLGAPTPETIVPVTLDEIVNAEDSEGFPGIGLSAHLAHALFVHNADAVSVAAKDAL